MDAAARKRGRKLFHVYLRTDLNLIIIKHLYLQTHYLCILVLQAFDIDN